MRDEEDHAVLSDEAKQGNSRHLHGQQDSRKTAQYQSRIDNSHQGIAREEVLAHIVSTWQRDS